MLRTVAVQRGSFGVVLVWRNNAAGRTESKRVAFAIVKLLRGRFVSTAPINDGWNRSEYRIHVGKWSLDRLTDRLKEWKSTAVCSLSVFAPGTGDVSNFGTGSGVNPIRKRLPVSDAALDEVRMRQIAGDLYAMETPSIDEMLGASPLPSNDWRQYPELLNMLAKWETTAEQLRVWLYKQAEKPNADIAAWNVKLVQLDNWLLSKRHGK